MREGACHFPCAGGTEQPAGRGAGSGPDERHPLPVGGSFPFDGTDTDAFAFSGNGIASALISLPLRYMHTTVEMVAKEDVENTIRLIYHSLLSIRQGQDFRYLKL